MGNTVWSSALYARLLGDSHTRLAAAVRDMHRDDTVGHRSGVMRVTRGANRLARWLAALLRLPAAGEAVPVTLVITPSADGEEWRRTFAGKPMCTRQWSRLDGQLVEQSGPGEVRFRLEVCDDGGLVYHPAGVALRLGWLRVPLPRWLAPTVTVRESPAATAGQTDVSVRVSVPLLGLLISYEGWMTWSAEEA
jgi:hypothetical protein